MHRPRLDWEAAGRRALPGSVEGRIFSWIRSCLARRRELPALAQDSPFEILPSPCENVLLCRRGSREGGIAPLIVAANFAPEDRRLCLAPDILPADAFDFLHGRRARIEAGELALGAYGVAWLAASPA